ncbi:hypothetical protein FRC07_002469 [Ceratobasidium sp. 392]|nr:hypothetical protein FRC07_002469 [Ceratobasidium sp. 392]
MSTRRALTTAVCPCGVSEEDCGRLWVNHTATCVAWIAKRRRLLDPATPIPHAGELVSAAEIDHSQISLPDTPPGISIEAPPQEEHGDDARTVSEPNQQPMVISKDGLRMVIRLPPSLRLPLQAVNMPPSGPSPMDTSAVNQDISSDSNRSLIWQSSQPNRFGLVRKYLQVQGHTPMIPDFNLPTAYFSRSIVNDTTAASFDKSRTLLDIIYPFPNTSTFRLAHWFITGSNAKSQDERTRLISDVILAPGFSPEHFKGVNLRTMDKLIDALDSVVVDDQSNLPPHATGDGWRSHELKISVPRASRAGARARTQAAIFSESFDEFGEVIDIPGLRTRSLVNVIRTHFSLPSSESVGPLHYLPYQHYWQHGTDSLERIYDELYTGNAWLQEHERLQNSPPVPGCQLERAIVAMMFSSDATHIGQFGQSYLWPIYLYFGNNSKWDRRRLSSRICEHIAYIPKMPDEVKSQLQMLQSGRLQPALLAHCKREIFHNCWRILIDDDFIDAYGHGMVVKCSDGVERRLYPRVFTYSADYPEK